MNGGFVLKPEVTWHPPLGCPRQANGGDGPRFCGIVACRVYLKDGAGRGRPSTKRERAKELRALPDHCTLDVVARARAAAVALHFEEIGALMGITGEAARQSCMRAVKKVRALLGISTDDTDVEALAISADE